MRTATPGIAYCVLLSAAAAGAGFAQPPSAAQKTHDSVITNYRVSQCCASTVKKCLSQVPVCPLARRLAKFSEWLAGEGKSYAEIMEKMEERERTLTDTGRAQIDISNMPFAGSPDAPVDIVAYISATCPLCKLITGEMYVEVTEGDLKGKARFFAKPFTRGFGDRAMLAAARLGKYWDYLRALAQIKKRTDTEEFYAVAEQVGIARSDLEQSAQDPEFGRVLERSHDEGARNGVTVTPTIFVNGRRYRSYKHTLWLIDAAEYEYEMMTALRPGKSPR
jgi:protein-disulfide isomerase